jgi:hypothetical protein
MDYYHIKLDADAQKIYTILLPWGKFKNKCLPLGIKIAPDIFQNVMSKLSQDMEYLSIITNKDFNDHPAYLLMVLA